MIPDFGKITIILSNNSIYNSASELHGIICGYLSAGGASDEIILIWHLLGHDGMPNKILSELILRLLQESHNQLLAVDFSFQPLLPDDDAELGLRLRALGNWCEGYISGFGGAYAKGDASLQEETREVLKDFTAIADIDERSEDGTEHDEKDLMEVVEYVRVAASTVFTQGKKAAAEETEHSGTKDNWH